MTFRETPTTPSGTCVFQILGCSLATKSSSITPRSWIMTNHDESWSSVIKVKKLLWTELFNCLLRYSVCWPHLFFAFALPLGHVIRIPNLSSTGSMLDMVGIAMYGCCHVPTPNHPTIQLSLATNLKNITNISSLLKKDVISRNTTPWKRTDTNLPVCQLHLAGLFQGEFCSPTFSPPRYIFTFVTWSNQVGSFTNQSFDGT